MGLFDSIFAELTCPHCGHTREMEIQTKIDPQMETYRVGDTISWDGILTIVFEDQAYCGVCSAREEAARKAIEARLRREFQVPDEVPHESWLAWPDGTPVLSQTKLHRALAEGQLPSFEAYCTERGEDPKIRGVRSGQLWTAYREEVTDPYLVQIRSPHPGMAMIHSAFRGVPWRYLHTEALDRLRAEGELAPDYGFPVIVEVIDRVLTSVRRK